MTAIFLSRVVILSYFWFNLRVIVEEFKGEPAAELNQKNNIFGIVAVDMKTNDDLVGTYKGFQMVIAGKGPIKSETLKNVPIK